MENDIVIPTKEIQANIKLAIGLSKKVIALKYHVMQLKFQKNAIYELRSDVVHQLVNIIFELNQDIIKYKRKISSLLKYCFKDFIIPNEFWFSSHDIDSGYFIFEDKMKNEKMVTLPEGIVLPDFQEPDILTEADTIL